jgi:hypothetical protein
MKVIICKIQLNGRHNGLRLEYYAPSMRLSDTKIYK